ncbi:MAG TPA: VgrG-related protein [Candidatus Limnocylindrales bacterium]|nr:VgrG-related protein [Candidatus Limnocylindrales bacterium]
MGGIGDLVGAAAGALGGGGSDKPAADTAPVVARLIKVKGTALKPEINANVESVIVHDRLRMPASFVITFRDPDRTTLSKSKIDIGVEITIESGAPGVETPDELMVGEVTSIEAEYDRLGTRLIVRGYDFLHRLSAGTQSRTFENTTYSDIVRKIAMDAGLTADVDSTSGTLDHVIQPNVSDLHFIYYLAGRCGYTVSINKSELAFKRPTKASSAPSGDDDESNPLVLRWGRRLLEFRARVSAVGQVKEVKVRGWDPKTQKPIIGQGRAGTNTAQLTTSVNTLTRTSKGKAFTVVNQPMPTQGLADKLAEAVAEQIGSAAYEATALVVGSPKLKSGVAVNILHVDPDLEGKWVITSARHEFGNGPYRTFLEFSGRQDRSLLGLAGGGAGHESGRSEFPGVVTAVVTDIKDDKKLGRVKVQYQWLGEKMVSFWARVARPSAGKDYGHVWFPDVDEEVLVAFEHGDVNYPIVIGSLWSEKNPPPSAWSGKVDNGKFQFHGFASPAGHKIFMNDDKEATAISLKSADDKITIVLDQKNKTLDLFLDGKELTITSKGDLKLAADGEISLDSKKKVTIKGQSGVDISASGGNTTIKGTKVAIN